SRCRGFAVDMHLLLSGTTRVAALYRPGQSTKGQKPHAKAQRRKGRQAKKSEGGLASQRWSSADQPSFSWLAFFAPLRLGVRSFFATAVAAPGSAAVRPGCGGGTARGNAGSCRRRPRAGWRRRGGRRQPARGGRAGGGRPPIRRRA